MSVTGNIERTDTDILILGSGGAGMFAALHASQKAPAGTRITIAVKGLLGKCGCTRMVQGGYNVSLGAGDTVERHFMDTIKGASGFPTRIWRGSYANKPLSGFASWKTRSAASSTGTEMARCTTRPSQVRRRTERFIRGLDRH